MAGVEKQGTNTWASIDTTIDKVEYITITQAVDLDTLESNVTTNNAKVSFDSTSSTKLSGIETGAEVNNISDVNATDLTDAGDSTLHYHGTDRARANHTGTQAASTISDFDTEVANNTAVTANTAKVTYNSTDSTKVGHISVTQAVDLDDMESDIAANEDDLDAIMDIGSLSFVTNTLTVDLDSNRMVEGKATCSDTTAKTIAFSNVPTATKVEIGLDIYFSSVAAVTYPATVTKWFYDGATQASAPTIVAGRCLFAFYSYDGGTSYVGFFAQITED